MDELVGYSVKTFSPGSIGDSLKIGKHLMVLNSSYWPISNDGHFLSDRYKKFQYLKLQMSLIFARGATHVTVGVSTRTKNDQSF